MAGFELILSAALCLSCAPVDPSALPANLIRLNSAGQAIGEVSAGGTLSTAEPPPSGSEPTEILSLTTKQDSLKRLREWINGRHLRIATLEDYPLSYTHELENGTRLGLGVSFEVIDFLQEKFNFTYEVVIPKSNIIGSTTDFTGSLVELLNTTDAHMAAAFVPLLSEPRTFVYYSTTTLDEGEWIMVMLRPSESATGSGLMAPFDFWVWILIFVSLLAVGPIIYLLIILRNRLTNDGEQKPYSLGHCAWFVYGALMKQGSTLSPVADSTRLLFATWWIFITILTSFYTANLTAFLTLSKFTLPFNSVDDIHKQNKHFVTARGSGVEYAIRSPNEPLSVLNDMIVNKYAVFSDNVNDSYNLEHYVEKSGYVFVRDRPAINHALYLDYRYRKTISLDNEIKHCPFAMAKQPFLKKKRAFVYPNGSNLSALFDPELLSLVESGIIKHLSLKNLPNAEICPQDLGGTERQLRNGDLMMTYYIMLAGFATSVVVFTTEIVFRYINSRQEASRWALHGVGRTPNGLSFAPSHWLRKNSSGKGSGHDRTRLTGYSNVTPPPPYQSIFIGSSTNGKGNTFQRWPRRGGEEEGMKVKQGWRFGGRQQPAEPSGVRRVINGRDYVVYRNPNGQSQLVPVRAPSAALFQYSYIE